MNAPDNRALRQLRMGADVDEGATALPFKPLAECIRRKSSEALKQLFAALQARHSVLEMADDFVEANAPEADNGLVLLADIRNDHNRPSRIEHHPHPAGELAAQPYIDRSTDVVGREVSGLPNIEELVGWSAVMS